MRVVRESTHLKIMQNDGLNTVKRRSEVHLVSRSPDVGVRRLQPKPTRISYPCVDTRAHREQARRARRVSLLGLDGDGLQVDCTFSPALAPAFTGPADRSWLVDARQFDNQNLQPRFPGSSVGVFKFLKEKTNDPATDALQVSLETFCTSKRPRWFAPRAVRMTEYVPPLTARVESVRGSSARSDP